MISFSLNIPMTQALDMLNYTQDIITITTKTGIESQIPAETKDFDAVKEFAAKEELSSPEGDIFYLDNENAVIEKHNFESLFTLPGKAQIFDK